MARGSLLLLSLALLSLPACGNDTDTDASGANDGDVCCAPSCDVDAANPCPNAGAGEECIPGFEMGRAVACDANAGVGGMPG